MAPARPAGSRAATRHPPLFPRAPPSLATRSETRRTPCKGSTPRAAAPARVRNARPPSPPPPARPRAARGPALTPTLPLSLAVFPTRRRRRALSARRAVRPACLARPDVAHGCALSLFSQLPLLDTRYAALRCAALRCAALRCSTLDLKRQRWCARARLAAPPSLRASARAARGARCRTRAQPHLLQSGLLARCRRRCAALRATSSGSVGRAVASAAEPVRAELNF